ncbi:hypothetical protein R6Z07F_017608 [Ovis aries]
MWARGPLRGRAGLTCTERSFQQEHRVSTEGSFQTGAAQAEPGSDVAEAGERQPPVLGPALLEEGGDSGLGQWAVVLLAATAAQSRSERSPDGCRYCRRRREEIKTFRWQIAVFQMGFLQIPWKLLKMRVTQKSSQISYIETLPKAVKRRINALKQLQVKCAHIEAKFYEEVHDLERKYAALYQPLFDKRREFVTGDVEPTDAESEWHSENEEEDRLAGDMKTKAVIAEKEAAAAEEPSPKGIPEFWFTIFRNVDMLSELVQEYDEPILKHLQDIKVKFSDPGQPMSFVLEFHFEPNDYFTNSVLTKTYKMKSEPDKADPFSFEGPEIVDCDGCTIDWKKGKNVTVKTIKKKQKHKGRGTVRTITKQVPNDSFFNFFSPLRASGDGESLDEDSEFTLASDFEIGHFFRERIVPRAVLYFTGEAIEDDDNFEEGEEGEEEELEGDEEAEDDDDAEINPKKEPSQPSECKQQ